MILFRKKLLLVCVCLFYCSFNDIFVALKAPWSQHLHQSVFILYFCLEISSHTFKNPSFGFFKATNFIMFIGDYKRSRAWVYTWAGDIGIIIIIAVWVCFIATKGRGKIDCGCLYKFQYLSIFKDRFWCFKIWNLKMSKNKEQVLKCLLLKAAVFQGFRFLFFLVSLPQWLYIWSVFMLCHVYLHVAMMIIAIIPLQADNIKIVSCTKRKCTKWNFHSVFSSSMFLVNSLLRADKTFAKWTTSGLNHRLHFLFPGWLSYKPRGFSADTNNPVAE